jgi:uncharacterized protein GlcG (DUF336 family)
MADHGVSLEQAQRIVGAATSKAASDGLLMNVAVVDAGDNLTAFARMDGAWLGSIDIAIAKAHTARRFDITTQELGQMAQPGEPLYGIHVLAEGGNVIFAGGIPLEGPDGAIVGAVGVSGGTPDQDHEVCQAGVEAFTSA